MKVKKKNLLITATAFLIIIIMSFSASAMSVETEGEIESNQSISCVSLYDGEFDIAAAKQELASLHEDEFVEMSEEKIQERLDSVDDLLLADITEEERIQKLEEMNVYLLEIPESNSAEYASSDASYVTLRRPVIYYNAQNKYWGIYASGCYNKFPKDLSWTSVFWPTVGKRYNIGDVDCYGFVIEDTAGSYNASLKSQKCVISDSSNVNYGTSITSTTKTTGSGRYGIGFEIQDKALISKSNIFTYSYTYIGYSFGCIGWYTDAFKNYRGNVQTVYGHTYSSCEVSDFDIGVGAGISSKDGAQLTANCGLKLSKQSKGFKGASSDTNLYRDGFAISKKTNPYSKFNP